MNLKNPDTGASKSPRKSGDLDSILTHFLQGLQYHFDLLALNIAGRQTVTEAAYESCSAKPTAMPLAAAHSELGQILEKGHDLLVGQVLSDCLNLAGSCMSNCSLFCNQLRIQSRNNLEQVTPDEQTVQNELQAAHREFLSHPLQEQFDILEREFSIVSPMEDNVISIGMALRCRMQKDSVVSAEECDENGELVFSFNLSSPESDAPLSPDQDRKGFRQGDRISFEYEELQFLLVTLSRFFQDLFHGVEQYRQQLKKPKPVRP